jgi:hypothetical protein
LVAIRERPTELHMMSPVKADYLSWLQPASH